jgi:hypothetical protein
MPYCIRSRFYSNLLAITALSSGALLGCSGTSVGNPPSADVKLAVVGTADDFLVSSGADEVDVGSGITLQEAWVSLREIKLQTSGTCDEADDGEYDVAGPFAAELVGGTISPEIPGWTRPAGERYCELRAKLRAADIAIPGASPDLEGSAVVIRGTRDDGAAFVARVSLATQVRISAKKAPTFALEGELSSLLLAFNFGSWLDAALLDAAIPEDGVIVIDALSNKEIEKSLRQRVPATVRLFSDKNDDAKLNGGDDEI